MTTFRPKLWTTAGAALMLAACSGQPGDQTSGAAASSAAPVQAAAGEGGEGGAEGGGEAGAQAAFQTTPEASKPALRLGQLKGFILIAMAQKDGAEAGGILLSQGLVETFDKAPQQYTRLGVDEALLRKAAQSGQASDMRAALANIEAAEAKAGGDPRAVAKGLVSIASGLYKEAVVPGSVDPIDYQHSLGAALAAQELVRKAAATDPGMKEAVPEMDKLVAMWPQTSAPEKPTPSSTLLAQASRLELELS
jgi:hypothetical protein